jgi:hypothetical protein
MGDTSRVPAVSAERAYHPVWLSPHGFAYIRHSLRGLQYSVIGGLASLQYKMCCEACMGAGKGRCVYTVIAYVHGTRHVSVIFSAGQPPVDILCLCLGGMDFTAAKSQKQ